MFASLWLSSTGSSGCVTCFLWFVLNGSLGCVALGALRTEAADRLSSIESSLEATLGGALMAANIVTYIQ